MDFSWIVIVLLSLTMIKQTLGLKCHKCDSSIDDYCPETWERDDIEPVDCGYVDYPAFCVKTTGIYGAIVGTRRFCSSRNMDNACMEVNIPQDPRIYYSCIYTCSSDGCNHATGPIRFNRLTSIIFLLISASFIRLF